MISKLAFTSILCTTAAIIILAIFTAASAEQYSIPYWVKNNTKSWGDGKIGDQDFMQGMKWLIQNNIMIIPHGQTGLGTITHIPNWVKNNAKWWANNEIDDSEFIKGIQYLFQVGIINISTSAQTQAPQNLFATVSNAQVTLSWKAPPGNGSSAITNYKIYRGNSSGTETLIDETGNGFSYTDDTVAKGQTYYYKVTAVNSIGESPQSNEVSATPTGATAPQPPTGLNATAVSISQIDLSWIAPPGTITGYKIERAVNESRFSVLIANTSNTRTSYSDTGLVHGTYTYRVYGINSLGTSPSSSDSIPIALITTYITTTSVSLNPSAVLTGAHTTATATVTATATSTNPPGTVSWGDGTPSAGGIFGSTTCNPSGTNQLVCTVTYTAPGTAGSVTVAANYAHSSNFAASAGSSVLSVTTPLLASITAPTSGMTGTQISLDSVVTGASPPYTYLWTMTVPAGSSAVLSSTIPNPTFTPDKSGNYILGLTVRDSVGHSASAPQATIAISTTPVTVQSSYHLVFLLQSTSEPTAYLANLNEFVKSLKPGDILFVSGSPKSSPSTIIQQTLAAKAAVVPGVKVYSLKFYFTIADIAANVTKLPKGFDYIGYDYEKGIDYSPEFTTDETTSIGYFDQAQTAVKQYNALTGSSAKFMVTPPYGELKSANWDWGKAAKHMDTINMQMQGSIQDSNYQDLVTNVVSQIRQGSPDTHLFVQVSISRYPVPDNVNAINILKTQPIDGILVFYQNIQTLDLQQLFNSLNR